MRGEKKSEKKASKSHSNRTADNGVADKQSAVVPMDRRAGDRRKSEDRRKVDTPVAVERRKLERRVKVSRRRQIDPTTCERDYNDDEIEFMGALDQYKRSSGRMFPTCSEVLEVIRGLGYQKQPRKAEPLPSALLGLTITDVFQPAGAV